MKSGIWLWDGNPFLPDFPKGLQQSRRTCDSSAAKQWVLNLRPLIAHVTQNHTSSSKRQLPASLLCTLKARCTYAFPCLGPET